MESEAMYQVHIDTSPAYCCYTAYWYYVVAKLKFKPGKFFLLAMVTKIITLWNAAYHYVVSCSAYLRTWDQNLEQEDNCDVLPYYVLLLGYLVYLQWGVAAVPVP